MPKNPEMQLEIRVSRRHEGVPHLSRVEGANPPLVPPGGQQAGQPTDNEEHMAENVLDFGYIDNPFTPWIMSHALPHGFQFAKKLKEYDGTKDPTLHVKGYVLLRGK